jgi:mRNA-degrading endonuclease RelE of RelBE toxin-antitoxin system
MMFKILYGEEVVEVLKQLPASKRKAILDKIEEQLLDEPIARNPKQEDPGRSQTALGARGASVGIAYSRLQGLL